MKKLRTDQSGSFSQRAILGSAALCSMIAGTLLAFFHAEEPDKHLQRTLTFAERVAYQRAIEDVYWRHRIWPQERPRPKPSLDAVMSQAQLERKVHDYLRKSQALEDYWQRPITPEQLQGEMDRMAKHTKQPQVLRELFQALGNDPLVIAECLARPLLAERLFACALAYRDVRWAVSQRTRFPKPVKLFSGYTLPTIATALKPEGTCVDAWRATSTNNAPEARVNHTAVWTGSEMIVWGGYGTQDFYLNTGGRYNPTTDTWMSTDFINAPAARDHHTAVWSGTEMIVWGGENTTGYLNSGGRYNPVTDDWAATSTTNAPEGRDGPIAVWTGSEMTVWGGAAANFLNTGGRYNPNTDSWTATSTTNAPTGRLSHTAVWTGTEMVVWGGYYWDGNYHYFQSGGRYNPSTDNWVATSATNSPEARGSHTAVWTGSEMIIWGGYDGSSYWNTGGRYNPGTDTWTATSTTDAPSGRQLHTAVWSGSEMIVWGGTGVSGNVRTGGRYDPGTDSWIATTTIEAPLARSYHTAVWTDSEMIVWGGLSSLGFSNTGGRYCGKYPPPTPTPSPTPTLIVTNTNDSGSGSLRQALADANDGDVIGFAVTGTIGLTSGELLVAKNITISGPGADNLTVNGNAKSTIFHVTPGEIVAISGLTVINGYTADSGGGIHNDHAALTLNNCTISGNSGGGIYNDAENSGGALLKINNSSLTENSGGGIYNDALGGGVATLSLTDSSVNNNYFGGAILSRGWLCTFCGHGTATVQITNSSITGNGSTPFGGAIYTDSGGPCCPVTLSLTNSTVSGNAGEAVHVSIEAATVVSNSTISGNTNGGIYTDLGAPTGGSTVVDSTMSDNYVEIWYGGAYINNTIFNVSPGGHSIVSDGYNTIMSNGYNVSSDDGGGYLNAPGDQINTDPMLGPLENNGGPTFTHELLPGSPAIDAGDPNFVGPPDYDQRGPNYYRVRGGRIDIGSFEVQAILTPTPTATATATATATSTATPTSTSTPRVTPTPRLRPTPRSRPTLAPRP
jgi:N-acetylneuraminic acid mutarotase